MNILISDWWIIGILKYKLINQIKLTIQITRLIYGVIQEIIIIGYSFFLIDFIKLFILCNKISMHQIRQLNILGIENLQILFSWIVKYMKKLRKLSILKANRTKDDYIGINLTNSRWRSFLWFVLFVCFFLSSFLCLY